MSMRLNLLNRRFGYLKIVKFAYTNKYYQTFWYGRCICGNIKVIRTNDLKTGKTRSCGCLALRTRTKHGATKNGRTIPEYTCWLDMKKRCYSKNDRSYKWYGKRGIKVCKKWLRSFKYFIDDVGYRPTNKYSLDRINNNGDYRPKNCRWATQLTQSNNKRQRRAKC